MFFVLDSQGSFVTKLKTFISNIHNDSVGIENAITNFLIMGIFIGGGEGNVDFRGAERDAGNFDGIYDQIVILLVLGFASVGAGKKYLHMYICI